MNFLNQNKFALLYFTLLAGISYFIFPFWSVMVVIWANLYFIIIYRKDEEILNTTIFQFFNSPISLKNRWQTLVFLYPLIETLLKAMIIYNIIPYSWRALNLAEHFLWSFCMYLMLLPYTKKLQTKLESIWAYILITGIVIIFGNLNEILEFSIRNFYGLTTQKLYAAYYLDTIIDLIVNLCGAGFGAVLGYLLIKSKRRV